MTKEEKIDMLNSMFVTESDSDGTTLYYCVVENTPENRDKLASIGVPAAEIEEMTDSDQKNIDISGFAFSYGEAEWYQNEEFLGYTP